MEAFHGHPLMTSTGGSLMQQIHHNLNNISVFSGAMCEGVFFINIVRAFSHLSSSPLSNPGVSAALGAGSEESVEQEIPHMSGPGQGCTSGGGGDTPPGIRG